MSSLRALIAVATPPPGYYEVWGDEFNGTSLDPSKWWCWIGPSQSAINTTEAVAVTNGDLIINTYSSDGQNYSGIISSDGLFRARYGYFESSIEFFDTAGEWSAYWIQSPTEGEFIGNPAESGAEMDVCEHRQFDSGNATNINYGGQTSVHWDGYSGSEKTATTGVIGSGLGAGFHTYGFLWTTTNYSFNYDDAPVWTTNSGFSERTEIFMFSQEVASNGWAGNVPTGGYGDMADSTTRMYVDYVRYFAPTTMVFWTGADSGDWTDGGNWVSNMIPASSSDVVFDYLSMGNESVTIPSNTVVHSLSIQECAPVTISGGTLTVNDGGIDLYSAIDDATITTPVLLGSNQTWSVGLNLALTVTGNISGSGNLITTGHGMVAMAGTNSATGAISVTNGTLQANGVISQPISVSDQGTLAGNGVITGPVIIAYGGALSPGVGLSSLAISNTLTLQPGSTTEMNVDANNNTCASAVGLTQLTYGGTLAMNNRSGSFAAGNTFKLFDAASYSGAFSTITPAHPGLYLGWDTNSLASNGTISVVNVAVYQMTNVVESRSGNSTTGANNPAFSYTSFSSTISATKSSASGTTSSSSRYTTTASSSTSFSVTPSLIVGLTYSVAVTWGYNSSDLSYDETPSVVVKPTATGVSTSTFPPTTSAFSSGSGAKTNNVWETIGTITPNVSNPVITFTWVSGLSSGRWYADAVRFISLLPSPGAMTVSQSGVNTVLNWSGNFYLQTATSVSGPFTNIPGIVVGPYTNLFTDPQRYFRLQ
ncbi:MAG TPA: family 16 glycosylhydrolase [Candidatus Saccharimonadales bacterium]|nr:family 16 glycosylhydrolase [Candidatus Saccharimonadales bacterium]